MKKWVKRKFAKIEFTLKQLSDILTTELKMCDRMSTASAYESVVHKAQQILGDQVTLSELFSLKGIQQCKKEMYAKGLHKSTIASYMRTLRAIYNKGVAMDMCTSCPRLFDGIYMGIGRTPKRAISPNTLEVLQKLDLAEKKNLAFARDLFLLSFSLQGISFVDLAYLRKSDLKGKMLTYHRTKTHSLITVGVTALSLKMIKHYESRTKGSPYLLPIIKNADGDTYLQYRSALRTYNRRLEKITGLAGIKDNLTSYVARHTWATMAHSINTRMGLISQGMGHSIEKTTRIYLTDFDYSLLLEVNEKILAAANLVSDYKPNGNKALSAEKENVSLLESEGHFPTANIS